MSLDEKLRSYDGYFSLMSYGGKVYLYKPENQKLLVMKKPPVDVLSEKSVEHSDSIQPVIGGHLLVSGKFERTTNIYGVDGNDAFPTSYMALLYTQYQDFLVNYRSKGIYNVMFMDIETYTDGSHFPDAKSDPILAIGYAINGNTTTILDISGNIISEDDYDENAKLSNEISIQTERKMLELFIDVIDDANIDIIVTYNGLSFDMPYILDRCKATRVKNLYKLFRFIPRYWDHDNKVMSPKDLEEAWKVFKQKWLYPEIYKKDIKNNSNYFGRLHYDIYYNSVINDQSLTGIKNRKMKTIAKHYGIDVYDDINVTNMIGEYNDHRDRFNKYLFSDINITRELYKHYWPTVQTLCENLSVAYDFILTGEKSSGVAMALLEESYNAGWIPHLSSSSLALTNKFKGSYGGAIVGIKKVGIYAGLFKYDVTSFYPNIMLTFGLGFDNVSIAGFEPYTGRYSFFKGESYNEIVIPDIGLNTNIRIRIYNYLSPSLRVIQKYFWQRSVYKKGIKHAKRQGDKTAKTDWDGYQQGVKVIINSIYGLAGVSEGLGNTAVALAVTGLARYIIANVASALGDNVIEIDTDGVLVDRRFDMDSINNFIEDTVLSTGCALMNTITMTEDRYVMGFVPRMKNYILIDEDGSITKHGAGLKGSRLTGLQENMVRSYIDSVLRDGNDYYLWKRYWSDNYDKLGPEDYILQIRFSKHGSEYTFTSMQGKLVDQYKKTFNRIPDKGEIINYLYMINNFTGESAPVLLDIYESAPSNYKLDYRKYIPFIKALYSILDLNAYEDHIFA